MLNRQRVIPLCGALFPSLHVMYPDFPLESTRLCLGKHLIRFLVIKMQEFLEFELTHISIVIFNAEQVYLKLPATNIALKLIWENISQFEEKIQPANAVGCINEGHARGRAEHGHLRSNAGCSSDQADCIAVVGALPAPSLWQRGTLMIGHFDDWALRPGAACGLFSSAWWTTTGGSSGTE